MKYSDPVNQLLTLGEFEEPPTDYSTLGITPAHSQELIQMGTDHELLNLYDKNSNLMAAIHAWYALGQSQITQAIPILLDLNDRYTDDFLFEEEFPNAFALMGPSAIPILKDYIDDKTKPQLGRSNAMVCLTRLGQDHRSECISVFSAFLNNATPDESDLAGDAVCGLLELKAIESIESIRDAFDRQCINISIPGDIEDVEIDLGLRKTRSTPAPNYNLVDKTRAEVYQQLEPLLNSEKKSSAAYLDGKPQIASGPKIGRNDPCPCGSGKKYKKCCLH